MKRHTYGFIMIFVLAVLCPSLIFAFTPYKKKIVIQGGYDDVGAINITAVPAQSEQYKIGMPFAINDSSVQNSTSQKGRIIANWNVLANNKFIIDIEAEVLHHVDDPGNGSGGYRNGLGYILNFTYNLSYYSGKDVFYIPERIYKLEVPDSETNKTVKVPKVDLLTGITLDPNSLVGSADGEVYFMFDKFTSDMIATSYNSLPDGNYTALIKLTLKVE